MGLFSLTQELAIDLGTANTLIIHNGRVVVDEPSIVAIDSHSGKLVAIGERARAMHEKTNPNIKTIRPLKDGVIADFTATELMLRGMIKKVKSSGHLFSPSIKMVICIPSGSTNVEIRAVGWSPPGSCLLWCNQTAVLPAFSSYVTSFPRDLPAQILLTLWAASLRTKPM